MTPSDGERGYPAAITEPYLLVINIPCFLDEDGNRWTDALWHKDLIEHLIYLKNFTLAAPLASALPPAGTKCLSDDSRFAQVNYVDLPASNSFVSALLNWPRTFAELWRAGGRARVIHTGVAGWPIPIGWTACLVAKLRNRTLLVNVESAFWRVPSMAPLARRLRSWIWEHINRWCVRGATLPLFTHEEYARQMLRNPGLAHIFNASWVNASDVLDDQTAKRSWDAKEADEQLRLLFAGRLVPEKGLSELLEASAGENLKIRLDIIGSGEMEEAVRTASLRSAHVRLLSPIPYGEPFFQLLRGYHALILPTRSDEQPRIAYDAYSQAVPVLATRTPGNVACVVEGETGYLTTIGTAAALRALIERAVLNRAELRRMGMQALLRARSYTHQEMHRRRWELLDQFVRANRSSSPDA